MNKYYFESYLDHFNKQELENNWWYALQFFFDHSFDQGRSDVLSKRYCTFTTDALEDRYSIKTNPEDAFNKLKADQVEI